MLKINKKYILLFQIMINSEILEKKVIEETNIIKEIVKLSEKPFLTGKTKIFTGIIGSIILMSIGGYLYFKFFPKKEIKQEEKFEEIPKPLTEEEILNKNLKIYKDDGVKTKINIEEAAKETNSVNFLIKTLNKEDLFETIKIINKKTIDNKKFQIVIHDNLIPEIENIMTELSSGDNKIDINNLELILIENDTDNFDVENIYNAYGTSNNLKITVVKKNTDPSEIIEFSNSNVEYKDNDYLINLENEIK